MKFVPWCQRFITNKQEKKLQQNNWWIERPILSTKRVDATRSDSSLESVCYNHCISDSFVQNNLHFANKTVSLFSLRVSTSVHRHRYPFSFHTIYQVVLIQRTKDSTTVSLPTREAFVCSRQRYPDHTDRCPDGPPASHAHSGVCQSWHQLVISL